MDMNAVTALINSVGFPIVCVIALFWYINKTMKELSQAVEKNTEATKELAVTVRLLHQHEEDKVNGK